MLGGSFASLGIFDFAAARNIRPWSKAEYVTELMTQRAKVSALTHDSLFPDRGRALDEAVGLLKKRLDLLQHLDEGTRQLAGGDYTEYDEKGLREFFDDVQREGRERYEATRKGR